MKINPLSPKWQHEDPNVRIRAIEGGKLDLETLKEMALNDQAAEVSRCAIKHITDTNVLMDLSETKTDAAQQWAVLKGADLQDLALVTAELKANLLAALLQYAPKEEFRLAASNHLSEEALVESLLVPNLSKVHQHCATLIADEKNLVTLQKYFKDKDKNVSRILKSKLQVIQSEQEKAAVQTQETQSLLNQIKILRNSEPEGDFSRRLTLYKSQWQALEDHKTPQAIEAQDLLNECQAIFDALPDPREVLAKQIAELTQRCNELRTKCLEEPLLTELSSTLKAIISDWPTDSESELKHELTRDLSDLARAQEQWRKIVANKIDSSAAYQEALAALNWPETFTRPEHFETTTTEHLAHLKEREAKQQLVTEQQVQIDQALNKFESEIGEGHTKAANRANTKVSKLLSESKANKTQLAKHQQLQAKLQELKDWQGFATQPKRDELCKKMQMLAEEASIPVLEKAKAIKELQDEWRSLGPSDSRAAQKSWTEFKAFGDTAYAPVAEFFKLQEEQRTKNLEVRQTVCLELETLDQETQWEETVNWRQIASQIQSAETKWRQNSNIPRRDKKSIEKRFHAAVSPIKDRLANEQKNNIAKKQALIENLKTLLASEDQSAMSMINEAKSAQQQWKSIGFIDRRKDQRLWKAFRTQCDLVFSKRDEEKQAEKTQANEQADLYRKVCKAFDSKLDGEFDRKDIAEFRKEITTFELPRQQSSLQRDATKMIKRAESLLKNRAKQNEELMFREFQKRCNQLDSGAQIQSDDDITLSKVLSKALEERGPKTEAEQDLTLIRLEILSDLSSPEDSQAARMAYQVERLNRELSRGEKETRSESEQVQALLTQWFITDNKLDILKPRFQKIASKLGIPV